MSQPTSQFVPTGARSALNKHLALATLKRLGVGTRLNFDDNTYVLRDEERYIAYRTWMSIFPVIEIFQPDCENELIDWLEQYGYSF